MFASLCNSTHEPEDRLFLRCCAEQSEAESAANDVVVAVADDDINDAVARAAKGSAYNPTVRNWKLACRSMAMDLG